MIVYELQFAADDDAALLLNDEGDLDILIDAFHGTPLAAQWQAIGFHWETEGGRFPIPDVTRFDDGEVMRIKRYEFVPGALRDATIFKLPQQPHLTYVTDAVADRARAAALTGMDLVERWRSP